MNTTDTEHQAVASAADTIPDHDSTWRVMACIRACGGDHKAGLVLNQLVHWWPHKRSNHRGVKKSVTDWRAELMLGEKEVKRINRVLTGLGFVEIYTDAWGHFKSPSTFYVLLPKAFALMKAPLPMGGVVSGKAPLPMGGMVSKAPLPKGEVTENTKDYIEEEKTKPVDASLTTGPGFPDNTPETINTPNPTPETGKILAWGKTFDDAVAAEFGKPAVALPKSQRELLNRNVKLMCRRLLDPAGFTPEQVHAFLRYVGGEGWMTLRTEWGPVYHPAIHKKEQPPYTPDIAWLVGSPEHGTGAYRLAVAVDIWQRFTQPEKAPTPKQPAAAKQAHLSWADLHPEEYAEFAAHHAAKKAAEAAQSSAAPMAEPAACAGDPEPQQAVQEVVLSNGALAEDDPNCPPSSPYSDSEFIARWLAAQPKPEPKPVKKMTCTA